MIDDETIRNFAHNTHELWIQPELKRRQDEGRLPDNFQIYRYLIRLPKDRPPIVEFNEEVHWIAKARRAGGELFTTGDDVFLHDIAEVISVEPPEVDGNRVAFVFLGWNGLQYEGCFDFSPNWDPGELPVDNDSWAFGEAIARHIQARLVEQTIHVHDSLEQELRSIGLWAVPALLPYPLSEICRLIRANELTNAKEVLLNYCSPEFIKNLTTNWWDVKPFAERKTLIEQAIQAHELGQYALSVHALVPQSEGVITDWEYDLNLQNDIIPFRTESKTKKFRDLLLGSHKKTFSHMRIIESVSSFMLDGPVLATFRQWLDNLDPAFPSRHAIGHGRFDPSLYTKESSIKVILLLDTICQIIRSDMETRQTTP